MTGLGCLTSVNSPPSSLRVGVRRDNGPEVSFAGPYVALGQIYGSAKEYQRAIGELDQALAKNPDQPVALMLWSIAQQMGGEQAKAREGYEKLLKTNPRFAPAANNLAWMIAEEGKDLGRAQLLASGAREAAPGDPQIADTLGWVMYKQGAYPGAEALLREAAEKLPTNAEVLYHLGMAQASAGQERRGPRLAREEPAALGHAPRRSRREGGAGGVARGEVSLAQPSGPGLPASVGWAESRDTRLISHGFCSFLGVRGTR